MIILPPGRLTMSGSGVNMAHVLVFFGHCLSDLCVRGSEHDYWTIPAMNLPFDDPLTNLCSPRTPHVSSHSTYRNDQRVSFGSGKSPWFHYGKGEVRRFCLESMLVSLEIGVKRILLSAGVEESNHLMYDLFQGMTLSALSWGEHDTISMSYVSDFAKLECSSFSAHVAQFLQVMKSHIVKLQHCFIHVWCLLVNLKI